MELEAVKRVDALFDVERGLGGLTAEARLGARQRLSRPLVDDLHGFLLAERARMSKHNPVVKAINCMFEKEGRWTAFTRFLDDGRICRTNNAAERSLRGATLGRKSWLFAGSERGGPCGLHVFADRNRQAQRDRSAGLAGRRPGAHAEHARLAVARSAALELGAWPDGPAGGSLMVRTTHVCTIDHVATLIGENLELLREVASNPDNIDYREMIHVQDGTEEGITTFTDRGIESLQAFLADVRPGTAASVGS